MQLPEIAQINQSFDDQHMQNITSAVTLEIKALDLVQKIKPGQTVAITAGSRGISNIVDILRTVVDNLKELGARPFIFPAMGSHGGATDQGQLKLLEGIGITEASMGCPVRSSMEVVYLGDAADGYPIYVDQLASEADHIAVVNRVKAHTKFKGPIESGLMKMMAIGMGKHKGAKYYHKAAVQLTFQRIVERVGLEVIQRSPILFGLGIVENAYHQTCLIKALAAEDIFEGEKDLLVVAKERMARLPFKEIDVLVVDQIGKDVSGTGMDTNVTGRNIDILGDFPTDIHIKRIFVRDLTDETEGNAIGVGYADFVTARLVDKMDRHKTYINCLTAISPEKGSIPIYFDTDREALEACLNSVGDIAVPDIRLVHIKDTLSLTHLAVSRAYAQEIADNDKLALKSGWNELALDSNGNMTSPFSG